MSKQPERRWFESLPSTQDKARLWADQGAEDGALVIASTQTQGRGRRGRQWFSAVGNCYLSQVLRPSLTGLPLVPILGAVAAWRAVASWLDRPSRAGIKWPNDIEVDGLKLGGILCESVANTQPLAILGIGINLNLDLAGLPNNLRRPATSLGTVLGSPIDPDTFGLGLIEQLLWTRKLLDQDPGALLDLFRAGCTSVGRQLAIQLPGREPFRARALRINDQGGLEVQAGGEEMTLFAGDADPIDED